MINHSPGWKKLRKLKLQKDIRAARLVQEYRDAQEYARLETREASEARGPREYVRHKAHKVQEHGKHEHVRQGEHVGHKTCEAREHVTAQGTRACKAQSTESTRAGKAREPYKLMESNKAWLLKKFVNFTGKHQSWTLLFYKTSDLQLAILFKKRLRHRCFPVSFVNNRKPNDCFDILCDRTYAETPQVFFFILVFLICEYFKMFGLAL